LIKKVPGHLLPGSKLDLPWEDRWRGRMDRHTKRLLTPKDIYVYPLAADFRSQLKGETAHE
ncbi:hypothetical protein, partial [Syntrophaceticus schinkii]